MSLPRISFMGRFLRGNSTVLNKLERAHCSAQKVGNSVRQSSGGKYQVFPAGGSPTPCSAAGQPTHISHPTLIKKGEITPGLTLEEYQSRRNNLLKKIVAYSPSTELHIVVVPSSPKKYMTEKIPYVFRQDSDFFYLTGCLEPDTCLVLVALKTEFESILFLRDKDPHAELWDGPRTGCDEGVELFGMDSCLPAEDLSSYLSSLLKKTSSHFVWYDYLSGVSPQFFSVIKDVVPNSKVLDSPKSFIQRLRLIKSNAEQELMRQTCKVGSEALIQTMKSSRPGDNEAHLFARVDFHSRMLGAQYLAYPPVVAGGQRANIIHYINNNQIIQNGELVLMDAGCELNGYTSDITRTWPISGRWSSEQRALYEMLYEVQLRLIAEVVNRPSLNQLFGTMCNILGKGLMELGVFKATSMTDQELSKAAFALCPHHVSHYLGMDVHDTGSVPRDIPLQPGMVFTIEPGVYVNSTNRMANPLYHGLGMRIEDDLLITESGVEVLTASCPKHPDLISNLILHSH